MEGEFLDELTGYVLIGGKSSRMGADKAFLKFGAETFVERAVKTLASVCSTVKIVLNKNQTDFILKLPGKIPHIFDKYENRGAPGGLHAAFADCQTKYAVILAVDLPNVTDKIIEKLAEITFESGEFSAIVPRQIDGKLQPLCAVYRIADCLPLIEKLLIEKESVAVRDFLKMVNLQIIKQQVFEEKDVFYNVNFSSDYDGFILTERELSSSPV